MKRRSLYGVVMFLAAVGVLVPSRAHAVPIGTFSWQGDCGPFLGPCFVVENFSAESFALPSVGLPGQSFANVVVQLTTELGLIQLDPGPVPGEAPGVIPIGAIAQTTDDVSSFSISLAALSFDIGLQGVITLLDGETGSIISGLTAGDTTATVDFTPAAVPEPGTLLLVSSGLGLMALRRRRRRNVRHP